MADHERYLEPQIETMPRPDIEAMQQERLLELIPLVYDRSALVRRTWELAGVHPRDVRSYDDFTERAPFMDKDAVSRFRDTYGDPWGGLLLTHPSELSAVVSTSGTSGEPMLVPQAWTDDLPPYVVQGCRDLWEMGVRPGDYVMWPGARQRGPVYQLPQLLGAVPVLLNMMPSEVEVLIRASREHRPRVMLAMLGPMFAALQHVSDRFDIKEAFSSYESVVFTGEQLTARQRSQLEQWGLDMFDCTGTGDIGWSFDCREHAGCHIWEDLMLAEHVDTVSGAPANDGEIGEIVTTSLTDLVAPLVRYRSGDLVRLTRERCACGRTHSRFKPMGRKGDEVVVQGRSLVPADLFPAIESVPETVEAVFQIIAPQREVDQLRVRVGYDPERQHRLDDVRDRLVAAIVCAIGLEPSIELVPESDIVSQAHAMKIRRVSKL
jgi:phenylacetate-CoA ligase